jgi:hypothetical protein
LAAFLIISSSRGMEYRREMEYRFLMFLKIL